MDNMENGMQKLLSNHLSHIENDLKHLSGRRFDYAVVEEVVPDNDQDYKTL